MSYEYGDGAADGGAMARGIAAGKRDMEHYPNIPIALDRLQKEIDDLGIAREGMREHIGAIVGPSRPEPGLAEAKDPAGPDTSDLAVRLNGFAVIVRATTASIRSINERVEL